MRAMTFDDDSANPTENFLRVLDQFAALRTYSSAAPAVGGYRLLASRRAAHRKSQFRFTSSAAIAALASTRMRLTGFLSVLFIGGLGLAVLAGPSSCPCSNAFTIAEQDDALTRLGYVGNGRLAMDREAASETPTELAEAPFFDSRRSMTDLSSIITSAVEPRAVAPDDATLVASVSTADRLAEKFAADGDSGQSPAVRAVAAPSSVKGGLPPADAAVEVSKPPMTRVAAIDADEPSSAGVAATARREETQHKTIAAIDAVSAPEAHSATDDHKAVAKAFADDDDDRPLKKIHALRKRGVIRAYRSPIHPPARVTAKKPADAQYTKRAPKWAQQMFNNPWQSQAFSYTQ